MLDDVTAKSFQSAVSLRDLRRSVVMAHEPKLKIYE